MDMCSRPCCTLIPQQRSLRLLIFYLALIHSFKVVASSEPLSYGPIAVAMFTSANLPHGLPLIILLFQKIGFSATVTPQRVKAATTPARVLFQDDTLLRSSSSTDNDALVLGRHLNVSGFGDGKNYAFLFDFSSVIDYTFPCGDYEDAKSLEEWTSLAVQIWLPCENPNVSSNRSQLQKREFDRPLNINGTMIGVKEGECYSTTTAECNMNVIGKNIDSHSLSDLDKGECKAANAPVNDWKSARRFEKRSETEIIGYRVTEMKERMTAKLNLTDPKSYKWLALFIFLGGQNIAEEEESKIDLLRRHPPYLRFRTQSERCHVQCGSTTLCRAKRHCVKECGLECDFEKPCPWTFEPPNRGFRVVSGKEKSGKSVQWDHTIENPSHYAYFGTSKQEEIAVKIVSPYLQRTGPNCKLRFQYRLHGMPKTELLVVLEHLHDPSKTATESPMQLAMIPAKSSINTRWTDEVVPIGAIRLPMRIRLEAWLNNQGRGANPVNFSADSYIDHISLIDCQEELYHPDTCQRGRSADKYRCELNKVCIEWDQLCDMKADCFDGEDESEQHNCSQVPMGARCTFENGMCGWVNSSEGDFRWVLANASYQQVVERELGHKDFTTDHTYGNASGHFMYAEHGQSDSIVRAYLTSPKFPRTSKATSDASSPYHNQCRIRFFFRHIGRDWHSLHLHLLTADGTNQRRLLWEADPGVPSASERLDSLRWTRVSVIIPHQDWEYQLQFTALRMALYRGHFGIDDVSMTPQCFIEDGTTRDVPIAYPYNFTSCGSVGARGPNQTHCDTAYNNTAMKVKVVEASPTMRGYQTWRVPMTGEYRIVAAGAAGGTLWGDEARSSNFPLVNNNGTEIETVFNLTENDQLLFLVGQRGESPCQAFTRDRYRSLRFRNKAALLNEICSSKRASKMADNNAVVGTKIKRRKFRRRRRLNRQTSHSLLSQFGKEHHSYLAELPGAGGGGATLVAKLNPAGTGSALFVTLIVSAGGGGLFLGAYNTSLDGLAGANGLADDRQLQYPAPSALWEDITIAGGGGGFEVSESGVRPLARIPPASGRPFSAGLGGGVCPRTTANGNGLEAPASPWSFEGGFGGGGASCGPGGGGGGGYVGGAGGNFTHGSGGWSYAVHSSPVIRPRRNAGSGYIHIYPCLLPCPAGSMCQFVQSMPICRCPDGTTLEKQGSCPEVPAPHNPDDKTISFHQPSLYSDHYLMFTVIIVALIAASVVAVVLYLIYRNKWSRKRKLEKYKRYSTGVIVGSGTMPMHQFPGGHNFHAEFNPNYEMFNSGALQELKEIPRQCVTLIRALGQGAFGEVYEGLLSECNGEANNLPIAVKSLPEFATEQAQMDFHMEALIMSKFTHPNIVRFIGVCFEKMPRFIILELLAGGDLKTFLRENRPKSSVSTKLAMADLLQTALDVARGCQYLEENHFIHRDIAARNCLLTTKGEDRVVKIADFGMARDIYRADYYRKGGKAMLPVKWMPPEAFLDGIFTTKTDVWSFGVLLWEIFSLGYMPYPGRGNQEVMQLVTAGGRLEAPTGCPAQIYQIMTQCWHTVADQRPRFSTIIERLGYCLQDPDVVNIALPMLSRAGGSSTTVDPSAMLASVHSACVPITSPTNDPPQEIVDSCQRSEGTNCASTVIRAPYSTTNGVHRLFQPPEPMPTPGSGVSTGVCPPYHPHSSDTFLPLHSSPKQSAGSASDCATDVLLISSAARNSESTQPTIIDNCKPASFVQPSSSTFSPSLFNQTGGHEPRLDDDVFIGETPQCLIHSNPVGPV